jgi:hypothetical protein
MGERAELLYRIVWPYVQEIISQVLDEKADLREATAESLAEINEQNQYQKSKPKRHYTKH